MTYKYIYTVLMKINNINKIHLFLKLSNFMEIYNYSNVNYINFIKSFIPTAYYFICKNNEYKLVTKF